MSKYVDIHTHNLLTTQEHIIIYNQSIENFIETNQYYSIGIHPWDIENINLDTYFNFSETKILDPKFVAIGECGLDKSINKDYKLQETFFIEQIRLAKKYQKILIIHCVRYYGEIIRILKQEKFDMPVIFHAFYGSLDIAKQIIKEKYFISIGLKNIHLQKVQNVINNIPIENLFLETDNSNQNIIDIYQNIAKIKEVEKEILKDELYKNLQKLFSFTNY